MIQVFYDENNDRFMCLPLRCGSSYTGHLADALGWTRMHELMDRDLRNNNQYPASLQSEIENNSLLQILSLMQLEKYKDSQWVHVVRDPWSRYISAANMILTIQYGAPEFVPQEELDMTVNEIHTNSFYTDVDRQISKNGHNAVNGFDFTLGDGHLIPVLSSQLFFYLINKNVEFVQLTDWTHWLKDHYPTGVGDNPLQHNFYDIIDGDTKRPVSDIPTDRSIRLFNRFLKNNQSNYSADIITGSNVSFDKFIQYEYAAWDFIVDVPHKHAIYQHMCRDRLLTLFEEILTEPYFYLRHGALYNFYLRSMQVTNLPITLSSTISKTVPDIHTYVIKHSWLNVDSKATGNY